MQYSYNNLLNINQILNWIKDTYIVGLTIGLIALPIISTSNRICDNWDCRVVGQNQNNTKTRINSNKKPLKELLLCSSKIRGEKLFNVCISCHSIEKGLPHKIGPNLWGVILRPIASFPDYMYSQALKSLSLSKWRFTLLSKFIKHPTSTSYIKGTYMSFSGIKDSVERMGI